MKNYIKKDYIKTVFNLIVEYHLQLIILMLIMAVLSLKHSANSAKIYYFDAKFIQAKLTLHLAKEYNDIKSDLIHQKIQQTEEDIKNFASNIIGNSALLHKSVIMTGGVDLTYEVCTALNFDDCNNYYKYYEN